MKLTLLVFSLKVAYVETEVVLLSWKCHFGCGNNNGLVSYAFFH